MRKNRELDHRDIRSENFGKQFPWIRNIQEINSPVASGEAYFFSFRQRHPLQDYDPQRESVESFVKDFFEVNKGRASVIFCWRHTELMLLVFRP